MCNQEAFCSRLGLFAVSGTTPCPLLVSDVVVDVVDDVVDDDGSEQFLEEFVRKFSNWNEERGKKASLCTKGVCKY